VGYGRHATHTICEGSLEKQHAPGGVEKEITEKIVGRKGKIRSGDKDFCVEKVTEKPGR
jgi:hypothetical protein